LITVAVDKSIVVPPTSELVELAESATEYAVAAQAKNTRRAYEGDWRGFVAWCGKHGLEPLCAEEATVLLYLTESADTGRKASTIGRRLAGITYFQRLNGCDAPTDSPAVRTLMRGIRRRLGTAPDQKAPLVVEELRRVVEVIPDDLRGKRDRSILCTGVGGARRRSELVDIDVRDLTFKAEGLEVFIRSSKTDQEGQGDVVGIPFGANPATCPVRAMRAWLDASGITEGAIFRSITRSGVMGGRLSDRGISEVVKRRVAAAGLDPDRYAGHSLRSGLATSAARAGKSERAIMRQTGHKSPAMVRRYIRLADVFQDNAAAGIGL
jgi:integrase